MKPLLHVDDQPVSSLSSLLHNVSDQPNGKKFVTKVRLTKNCIHRIKSLSHLMHDIKLIPVMENTGVAQYLLMQS